MTKKIQMMSHDKEWQIVNGVETLVPVEQFDIDPVTDSSCVKIEGFRTLEETLNEKNMFTPEVNATKVMDKVGGEYHQNVVDGAYEEAILYGNTQVNLCEEDTSVGLQIPTTFTSFNNGELQIKNKESQVVAPLIKGVTMVNLAQTNSVSLASSESVTIENVKGNTLYTLSFKFTTKNTNSGVTIESYNGDTYLENTMHKTGLGDVAKFTFTVHADATVVKIVNNAAYGGEAIKLDEIMLIEGDQTALDIPFFKGMKSVELVRPLTNLFTDTITTYEAGATATNSSGNVTVTSKSSSSWSAISFKMNMLKNNTKYLVMWDSLNTTQTSTSDTGQLIGIYYVDTSVQTIGTINNNSICPTKRSLIFDTKDFDVTKLWLKIHATLGNTETGTTTVTGLRVFEYDDYLRSVDLQSIGYFSGTKNVAVEPIKTCSKNLYPYGDINFTPTSTGWFDAKGNSQMTGDIASKSHSRFLLEKGTYYFSIGSNTNAFCQLTSDKENMGVNANSSFTLQEDTYVTLRVKVSTANTSATVSNIQIERGETATAYVAHDSRYYEPNGQNAIVLRSLPSGVCDTFNLQTGEYVQRIGEVTFDGNANENWTLNTTHDINDTYAKFILRNVPNDMFLKDSLSHWIANRFKNQLRVSGIPNEEGISSEGNIKAPLMITIKRDKLTESTPEGFKKWLVQNPVTVQYQLTTPITTIIPRTIKRNNNGTVSTIDFKTYTNKESLTLPKNPTFLTINSMTSIKPVVEPITYVDFKTRLKANTDYSVVMDKDSANKTINLGGTSKTYADKMLVRTPSVNLEQNLRISGSGSIQNIMVIEGDVLDKELPYFNGMCNAKMPIVRNMGRNLLDNNNVRVTYQTNIILRAYPTFPCKPGKRYVYCVDKSNANVEDACNWYSCKRDAVLVNGSEATGIIEYLGYSTSVVAPPDCKYLCIYSGGPTSVDPYSIPAYVYEMDTVAEAKTIGYTDYKENQICLVQGEIGLSQDMFEQGGISSYPSAGTIKTYDSCKSDSGLRIRSKALFKINGGSTYRIRFLDSDKRYQYYLWDASGNSLGITGGWSEIAKDQIQTINTPIEAKYMSLMFKKGNNNANISVSDVNLDYFQLLELDSTVQLRSLPNGVKDELNLLTGEYIQRVGEVTFDGSEDEGWHMEDVNTVNYLCFDTVYAGFSEANPLYTNFRISDKFDSISHEEYLSDSVEGIRYFSIPAISISRSKLNEPNVIGFKQYLSQNPITVQYELAKPIISYPHIVSNTQEREVGIKLPNGVCDTYNPSTGITVKRVGKAILDGSEAWGQGGLTNDTYFEAWLPKSPLNDMKLSYDGYMEGYFTNMFRVDGWATPRMQSEGLANGGMRIKCGTTIDLGAISLVILKSKLSTQDINGFKSYLASNQLTVYYELANPVVTTDIVVPVDIHDEYNPITGLYTKRVGLTEFDGSDDEGWEMQSVVELTNTAMFTVSSQYHDTSLCTGICDKFAFKLNWTVDEEGCYLDANGKFCLRVAKSKLTTVDLYGFKTYLSQNPIKLWYALQMSQKIQLTPYFGLPMPYAYQGGHLIMDSAYDGVTLPPEFKYKLVANRTGQVNQNNIKLQQHTTRLSNLEAMLVEATLQSMYEREMMAFNLEMVNINLINLEE